MTKLNIKIEEVNNKIDNELQKFIYNSEQYYKNQLDKIASKIASDKQITFVLLAGPSSAGKTTTGKLLVEFLAKYNKKCKLISLDDFFLNRNQTPLLESGDKDFDSVNSIDWTLFKNKIDELLKNKKAILPIYNFKLGEKTFNNPYTTLEDDEILIFEGLHALNPILDNILPPNNRIKIFLNNETNYVSQNATIISNFELRLVRRLIRDMYTRHLSPESTIKCWENVRKCEEEYIFPYKNTANFIVNTSFFYEAGIYSYILNNITFEDEYLENIKLCFMNINKISPLLIPDGSLLFEFIVKGENYKNPPKSF